MGVVMSHGSASRAQFQKNYAKVVASIANVVQWWHSERTKVSKPSGAEFLLCSQVVHRRQEAKQGGEIIE